MNFHKSYITFLLKFVNTYDLLEYQKYLFGFSNNLNTLCYNHFYAQIYHYI